MKKRTMLFEEFGRGYSSRMLTESVDGEVKDIEDEVKHIKKELEDDGLDPDETEIKAQLLLQAIENDGDLEKIDVEKVKAEVAEHIRAGRPESPLNEGLLGSIAHVIEITGNIAGNADFMHIILEKIEKITGKKIDYKTAKSAIDKVLGVLKTVSGAPAKALIKAFEWVCKKFGVESEGAQKVISLVGRGTVLVIFFIFGIVHFPVLGGGLFMWILSLTGLLGKAHEILHIGKEFVETLKDPKEFKKLGLSTKDEEGMLPA